jgi:hypothetical protein
MAAMGGSGPLGLRFHNATTSSGVPAGSTNEPWTLLARLRALLLRAGAPPRPGRQRGLVNVRFAPKATEVLRLPQSVAMGPAWAICGSRVTGPQNFARLVLSPTGN